MHFIRFKDIVPNFIHAPMSYQLKTPLFFLICFISWTQSTGQQLNYRLGQLIVQLKAEAPISDLGSLSNRSSEHSYQLKPLRRLGSVWNIWLVEYDYIHFNSSEIMESLRNHPSVIQLQKNRVLSYRAKPNDPFFGWQWHHVNDGSQGGKAGADFDSDLAWDLTTGGVTDQGDTIVLCIIDDGIEITHEDLAPNMWVNHGEIPGNRIDDDFNGYIDDYRGWNTFKAIDTFSEGRHGTPVSGLAAMSGNNGLGGTGICWNTKIMFVAGGGDEANAIESYGYPLWFRRQYNQSNGKKGAFVVVTNSSWGSDYGKPEDAPLWCAIYDSLGKEGILNVASTSNQNIDVDIEGDLPTTCPSSYLIAVTNLDDQDQKYRNAGYGKYSIDLGAYGESVYSTYINNTYRNFGGTSAAAPQVSGAVALLYALPCSNLSKLALANPSKAALEVRAAILESVKPNASLQNISVTGGVLNLYNALLHLSPLQISSSSANMLHVKWNQGIQFPFSIRYRIAGAQNWTEVMVYQGTDLDLNGLEACTDYEIQFKGICNRFQENYSPIRIYKTSGCCDALREIKLLDQIGQRARFHFYDPSNSSEITALLRVSGTLKWDSFQIAVQQSEFLLNTLLPCTQYDLACFSLCNGARTPLSEIYQFTSADCQVCSNIDYCRRYRPSSDLEWLNAIEIEKQTFVSGNNQGYGNYVGTNHQWTFEKGKNYEVNLRAGYLDDSSQMVVAAWIDFDQDGQFEDTENFASPTIAFKYSVSYTLKVPQSAKSGYTRMRIAMKYAEFNQSTPLPCFQSIEFGEYEDYCVHVISEACNELGNVQLTEVNTQTAEFLLPLHSSSQYAYSYRKLYSSDWTFGTINSRILRISNLDSCSTYEIKLAAVCKDLNSNPTVIRFKTKGKNCISSFDNLSSSDFNVYPNPTTGQVHIQCNHLLEKCNVILYSPHGKPLKKYPVHEDAVEFSIDLPFPSGLYYLRIQGNNGKPVVFPIIKL